MAIGDVKLKLADNVMLLPGLLSWFDEGGQTVVLPWQLVTGLQVVSLAVPLFGMSVRFNLLLTIPGAAEATASAIVPTVIVHVLVPEEHVLPCVIASRVACSTASCMVWSVNMPKHILATEKSTKISGSPTRVNSSVAFPVLDLNGRISFAPSSGNSG